MAADAKKLNFAAELAIGKPNSLGNTLIVVKLVESNSRLFPQLLQAKTTLICTLRSHLY
jgi:hypothetical protein